MKGLEHVQSSVEDFYKLLVQWRRGLERKQTLVQQWEQRIVDASSFSMCSSAGKMYRGRSFLTTSSSYGCDSTASVLDFRIQDFQILQAQKLADGDENQYWIMTSFILVMTSQQQLEPVPVEERRQVSALLHSCTQEDKRICKIVHIHESIVPKEATSTIPDEKEVSTSDMDLTRWQKSSVPSNRRYISDALQEYGATPLLWKNKLVGISIAGFDIISSQGPIATSEEVDKSTEELEAISQYSNNNKSGPRRKICLPEMLFPAAHIAFERVGQGFFVTWDAMSALKDWAFCHRGISVPTDENAVEVANGGVSVLKSSYAHEKETIPDSNTKKENSTKEAIRVHYDWTFSTPFSGRIFGFGLAEGKWSRLDASGMPLDLLTDQSVPILLFDDIVLYEDDLHDNGVVQMRAKVRVMPSCAYLKCLLFVRVDRVVIRVRECRFMVDFRDSRFYRDICWRECSWDKLEQNGLPTEVRSWTAQTSGVESPAFLNLLSRLPKVSLPGHLAEYSVRPYT